MIDVCVHADPNWQSYETSTRSFGNRKWVARLAKAQPSRGCVQRYVMKGRVDSPGFEAVDQARPGGRIGHFQIIEVAIVLAI